jgi:hypothetical protein
MTDKEEIKKCLSETGIKYGETKDRYNDYITIFTTDNSGDCLEIHFHNDKVFKVI